MRSVRVINKASGSLLVLLAWDLLASSQLLKSNYSTTGGEQFQTSCDLLFMANDKLANYCHCKHNLDSSTLVQFTNPNDKSSSDSPMTNIINHLDCSPLTLAQFIDDIKFAMANDELSTQIKSSLEVNFLNINTNLTQTQQPFIVDHNKRIEKSLEVGFGGLKVDHMSLQLLLRKKSLELENSKTNRKLLEEQMINLASSINRTHLQFLSLFLEIQEEQEEIVEEEEEEARENLQELDVLLLLTRYTGLNRLELSLGPFSMVSLKSSNFSSSVSNEKLSFESLRWLNLASNERINFGQEYNFNKMRYLEHLSLENCNLRKFPLYFLHELDNLSSLNLANNKLVSLKEDFFFFESLDSSNSPSNANLLPALLQLDLSYNQLEEISHQVGQLILCSMPQLSQLYLQHNKLSHINLNLLFNQPSNLLSKLEYLDLSHNELTRITTFSNNLNYTSKLKYLNLAFNYLAQPINLINYSVFSGLLDSNNTKKSLDRLEAQSIQIYSSGASFCHHFVDNFEDNLNAAQELILNNNGFEIINREFFSSSKCKFINILGLARNKIVFISSDAFTMLTSLERLDLSGNSLVTLNGSLFSRNLELKSLDLSQNKMKQIDKNIISQLPKLEELFLNDNEILFLPPELNFAKSSPLLNTIDLSRNKLVNLQTSIFLKLDNLQQLILSENSLSSFDFNEYLAEFKFVRLLAQNRSIYTKYLNTKNKNNKQTAIQSNNLKSAKQSEKKIEINSINRRKNHFAKREIESIVEYRGQLVSNRLNLDYNSIQVIKFTIGSFNCSNFLQNLEYLSIVGNKLSELHSAPFKCTPFLQHLNLNSNLIKTIQPETFTQLKYLTFLDLSHNKLIQMQTLAEVPQHLDLSYNKLTNFKISSILPKISAELQLEELNLSYNNKLRLEVDEIIVKYQPRQLGLESIESVDRGGGGVISLIREGDEERRTQISSIKLSLISEKLKEQLFDLLDSSVFGLEELELNFLELPVTSRFDGKLEMFLTRSLENGLRELSFAGNLYNVQQLNRIFESISIEVVNVKLEFLNLSSNRLDLLPFNNLTSSKLINLHRLDLSQNKLKFFIMRDQINLQLSALETLNLSSNLLQSLIEISSRNSQSKGLASFTPKLVNLDLSHNKLTWLPAQLFQNLNSLKWLDLSNNLFESISSANFVDSLLVLNPEVSFTLDLSQNKRLQSFGKEKQFKFATTKHLVNDFHQVIIHFDDDKSKQIKCNSIEYFVNMHKFQNTTSKRQEESEEEIESRVIKQNCRHLLNSIALINLDSTMVKLDSISLGTIKPERWIHLSLRDDSFYMLNSFDSSIKNRVISLDLSDNKLQEVTGQVEELENLITLDISKNQLRHLPLTFKMKHINYLNLASNKISSLKNLKSLGDDSSLKVLILTNNQLTDLRQSELLYLKQLRYLDLRGNSIKLSNSIDLTFNRPLFIQSNPGIISLVRDNYKFQLTADDQSLTIIQNTNNYNQMKQVARYALQIDGSTIESSLTTTRYTIKYCSLDRGPIISEICIKAIETTRMFDEDSTHCFNFTKPSKIKSCLTSLEESQNNSSSIPSPSTTQVSKLPHPDSIKQQQQQSKNMPSNNSTNHQQESDFVLNTIDFIKEYWLRLRELKFNEYLATISNINPNSILLRLDNDKQPIYTITVLKAAIVLGSSCVILLLLAMFSLLTCNNHSKRASEQSSPMNQSDDLTTTTTATTRTDDLTGSSSLEKCTTSQSISSTTKTSSSSCQSRKISGSLGGTSDKELMASNKQATVMERHHASIQQLEAGQLMLLANQQCPTPSSSLAPSSVETAETLQAIDSIQSASTLGGHFRPSDCYSTVQQPQTATVMRMVKSNSTSLGFGNQPSGHHQQHEMNHYGTLNNYSQLKSKLKLTNTRQPNINSFYTTAQNTEGGNIINERISQYLPLNFIEQQQITTNSNQTVDYPASAQQQQASIGNLCHYHRLANVADVSQQHQDVILEQEEELFMHDSFPPPPSSRAIEALASEFLNYQRDHNN